MGFYIGMILWHLPNASLSIHLDWVYRQKRTNRWSAKPKYSGFHVNYGQAKMKPGSPDKDPI